MSLLLESVRARFVDSGVGLKEVRALRVRGGSHSVLCRIMGVRDGRSKTTQGFRNSCDIVVNTSIFRGIMSGEGVRKEVGIVRITFEC